MKQQDLEELLGQMSDAQVATWGLFVLEDCFATLRHRYWWNVYGLLLPLRAKRILEEIGAGTIISEARAFRAIEKVRRMAENAFGFNRGFLEARSSILHFFSEFQCGFEIYRTEKNKTFGQDSFRQLAKIPDKLIKYNLIRLPPDKFMEAAIQKAKELVGR